MSDLQIDQPSTAGFPVYNTLVKTAYSLIGIYGGTFDPIHYGHLRIAEELVENLQLDELHFLPAGQPRLRDQPLASRHQRSVMLTKAIKNNSKFRLDVREVRESGETYSVETLKKLNQEYAERRIAFCFIVGADAFIKLPNWYHWCDLFDLCHLIVVNRPGFDLIHKQADLPHTLARECRDRWIDQVELLKQRASGFIYCAATTPSAISATVIRHAILTGKSIRYLLPDSVINYIYRYHVYPGEK